MHFIFRKSNARKKIYNQKSGIMNKLNFEEKNLICLILDSVIRKISYDKTNDIYTDRGDITLNGDEYRTLIRAYKKMKIVDQKGRGRPLTKK